MQSVLDRTASGELIDRIMDIVKHEAFGKIADLMRFKGLVTRSVDKAIGKAVVKLADILGNDSNFAEDNDTLLSIAYNNSPDTEDSVPAIPTTRAFAFGSLLRDFCERISNILKTQRS